MSSLSQARGVFSNCGPGVDTYEIAYTCDGPSCSSITGFPQIECHSNGNPSGSSMSCSNDVKCPPGISSYKSNFTFSQNAPDPINPAPAEVDNRIGQHQEVILPDCGTFTVDSDGTKEGTSVSDKGTQPDCGIKVQSTPTPSAGSKPPESTGGKEPASTVSHIQPSGSSASSPEQFTGISSRRYPSKFALLFTFLFGLMLFVPTAHAYSPGRRNAELRAKAEIRVRAVSDKVRTFASQFGETLTEKANAVGENGETFAHNLVADVISSVCGGYFKGESVGSFTPTIVGDCVKSIYGGDKLPEPGVQFLAVFGASLLCDYAVSEAFPVAKEFFPDGCEGLQDLTQKIGPSGSVVPSNAASATAAPVSNPAASNPAASNPAASNPAASNPAASNPAASNPAASNPAASNPAASNPAASNPAVSNPAVSNPAVSNPPASLPSNPPASVAETNPAPSNAPSDVSPSNPLVSNPAPSDVPASVENNNPLPSNPAPSNPPASLASNPPASVAASNPAPSNAPSDVAPSSPAESNPVPLSPSGSAGVSNPPPSNPNPSVVGPSGPVPSNVVPSNPGPSNPGPSNPPASVASNPPISPSVPSGPLSNSETAVNPLPGTPSNPASPSVGSPSAGPSNTPPVASPSEPTPPISSPVTPIVPTLPGSTPVEPSPPASTPDSTPIEPTPPASTPVEPPNSTPAEPTPPASTPDSTPIEPTPPVSTPVEPPDSTPIEPTPPISTPDSTPIEPTPPASTPVEPPVSTPNESIPQDSTSSEPTPPISTPPPVTPPSIIPPSSPSSTRSSITSLPPFSNSSTPRSSTTPPPSITTPSSVITTEPPTSNSTTPSSIITTEPPTSNSTTPSSIITTEPSTSNSTTSTPPISTPTCNADSETPDFCPGVNCTSLQWDSKNCGTCGNVCEYECDDGICQCPDEQTLDETGHCVNVTTTTPPTTSPTPCPTGSHFNPDTNDCMPCWTGESWIDFCPEVGCLSLQRNTTNCGRCGHACDFECFEGLCYCDEGHEVLADDDGHCSDVVKAPNSTTTEPPSGTTPATCGSGLRMGPLGFCVLASPLRTPFVTPSTPPATPATPTIPATPSIPSTKPSASGCPEPTPFACNGGCVDFRSDRFNCGGCGRVCPATSICSNFECSGPLDPLNPSAGLGSFVIKGLDGVWKRGNDFWTREEGYEDWEE